MESQTTDDGNWNAEVGMSWNAEVGMGRAESQGTEDRNWKSESGSGN